jgi:acetyl-CoA C-acetyltransferase/acetyl-CoA acyltransferase
VDQIALDSQRRWGEAADSSRYEEQLVPVKPNSNNQQLLRVDEHPRPDTDLETLSELPLVFRDEGEGVVHAGNSSGIVDGAAAVLGWNPMARIVDTTVVGVDPLTMLTGPIPATEQLLEDNDMTIGDIDRFEVNEAFAPVISAWLEETGADWKKTNVWGGAIAHGHPLGATGAALVGKLPYQLEDANGRYGLSTMCIGFGQGIATLVEQV